MIDSPLVRYKIQRVNKTQFNYILIRISPDGRKEMYSRAHGWRANRGELMSKTTAMYLYNAFKVKPD